jgi:hypothetical protein
MFGNNLLLIHRMRVKFVRYNLLKIIQKWKVTRHDKIPINGNVNIDTMLFADNQVLLAKSEDDLQYSVKKFEQNGIRNFHGYKHREN